MVRAFLAAPSGVISLVVIGVICLVALVAPEVLQAQAEKLDFTAVSKSPSAAHLLGTDQLGRDVLARILVATRLSVLLGLGAVAIGAAIGLTVGSLTSVAGRRLRSIMQRVIDSLIAFPGLLVALMVGTILGSGPQSAMVGVGIGTSFGFARVSSALALTISGRDFIMASRVLGISPVKRMFRYVLPNIAETLLITTTVAISGAITAMSTLSFLGLGVQAPDFDWGGLLTEGVRAIYIAPAAAVGPAGAILVTALAFGFAGEAAARAMNPLLWTGRAAGGDAAEPPAAASVLGENDTLMPLDVALPEGSAPTAATRPSGTPVLQVRDLVVAFPGKAGPLLAVAGVSFDLRRGERLGIVGESGSGKTLTSMAIAQLLPPAAHMTGTIKVNGIDVATLPPAKLSRLLGTTLAVIFQDPMSSLNPALHLGTQLEETAVVNRGLSGREAHEVAVARLREVNMPAPERQVERYPHELSGGMRQRVMAAMALMNEPPLIIADEPTTALDVTIQAQIMQLLRRITQDHGASLIFISHNLALVSQFCDRVLVMYAGHVVEDLPTDHLLTRPLHPYTVGLLKAIPDLSRPRNEPFSSIPGRQPDLGARPAGCPYHPRCPLAFERCETERPPLVRRKDGRRVACWAVSRDVPDVPA